MCVLFDVRFEYSVQILTENDPCFIHFLYPRRRAKTAAWVILSTDAFTFEINCQRTGYWNSADIIIRIFYYLMRSFDRLSVYVNLWKGSWSTCNLPRKIVNLKEKWKTLTDWLFKTLTSISHVLQSILACSVYWL